MTTLSIHDRTPITFTAIDFETAQGPHWSICQIGLVRVVDGVIAKQLNILVQPPGNQYNFFNTKIHGISPRMTATAPTFNRIWPALEPYILNQNVVAHNAAFDCSCLRQTLAYYKLPEPFYNKHCTYKLYKAKLDILCRKYNIVLDHHNAASDALACAKLFLLHHGS